MYRPAYNPHKPFIHYAQTWAQLVRLLKNPAPIRPAAPPAHLAAVLAPPCKQPLPRLKGNVTHTMKEIMNIFLDLWRKAERPINLAIYTSRTALSKRCGNLDPKTSYRHILTLIEQGFLRAKVHVKSGLQLLLHPDLVVFDTRGAAAPVAAAAVLPAPLAGARAENVRDSLRALAALFNQNEKGRRRT